MSALGNGDGKTMFLDKPCSKNWSVIGKDVASPVVVMEIEKQKPHKAMWEIISELLNSISRRKSGTLTRVRLMGRAAGADMARTIWKKANNLAAKRGRYPNLVQRVA